MGRDPFPWGDLFIVGIACSGKGHEGIEDLVLNFPGLLPGKQGPYIFRIVEYKGQLVRMGGEQPSLVSGFVGKQEVIGIPAACHSAFYAEIHCGTADHAVRKGCKVHVEFGVGLPECL